MLAREGTDARSARCHPFRRAHLSSARIRHSSPFHPWRCSCLMWTSWRHTRCARTTRRRSWRTCRGLSSWRCVVWADTSSSQTRCQGRSSSCSPSARPRPSRWSSRGLCCGGCMAGTQRGEDGDGVPALAGERHPRQARGRVSFLNAAHQPRRGSRRVQSSGRCDGPRRQHVPLAPRPPSPCSGSDPLRDAPCTVRPGHGGDEGLCPGR